MVNAHFYNGNGRTQMILYFYPFPQVQHTTLRPRYEMKQKGALEFSIYSLEVKVVRTHSRYQHKVIESQNEIHVTQHHMLFLPVGTINMNSEHKQNKVKQ